MTATAGLHFERRSTRPGVHPYDEVAWERRDAAIGNESGRTVFEQKGVEVPAAWSVLATNIVASKYFRGHLDTPEREWSVRQLIDRVAGTIAAWGRKDGYFATPEDADTFEAELTALLLHQRMAFNSPVWFNLGLEERPNLSACYINSVRDDMGSIMDLAKTEALLFKGGSGAGVNLSAIRGSRERMTGGGIASGPISFMKGYDAFAGVVKSGGKTRRAAKMIILDADHPDIEEFIETKVREERKAQALIREGYDPSFNGEAYGSVFFQNANHSVRVTDEFMRAVERDGEWRTTERTTGDTVAVLKAQELLHRIASAAWTCGDPGIQFDTTINAWHTCPASGRINASNPCVTGDSMVATSEGWRRIDELVGRPVQVVGADGELHRVEAVFPTGHKPVFDLTTRSGYRLRVTADHRVLTQRGDVPADGLRTGDRIRLAGAGFGSRSLPPRVAEAIGLAVGDGCQVLSVQSGHQTSQIVLTMGHDEGPVLEAVAEGLNEEKLALAVGDDRRHQRSSTVRRSRTGVRLATANTALVEEFGRYAILHEGSSGKRFTVEVHELDRDSIAGILRGVFTADGTVADYGAKTQYVGLDSTSPGLLGQVQMLLLGFGIKSRVYRDRNHGRTHTAMPDGHGGMREYPVQPMHSLRISRTGRVRFEEAIGFMAESAKASALRCVNERVGAYAQPLEDAFAALVPAGSEDVFDLTEPATSHFVANGLVVHNCSEYMFVDDSSCNLASLNLMRFQRKDGGFDVEAYRHAAAITITAQEIIVGNASYPTPTIEANSRRFRPLGLGFANLGALLMSRGLPYDSDAGRAWAGSLVSIMHGEAYAQSARIARDCGGPFAGFAENREPMLKVIGMHAAASADKRAEAERLGLPAELLDAEADIWAQVQALGAVHGFRNAQSSVSAPTGTVSFLMDCDTTGIEPDVALIKYKKLVGEGYLKIVNNTVPAALRALGYEPAAIDAIVRHIDETGTVEGAADLRPEHLPVFDCALKPASGTRSIAPMGHLRMMAAVQPFLSGAISKTVNLPNDATVEDIESVYLEAWRLGLKAVAVYRDGCKSSQPLNTSKTETAKADDADHPGHVATAEAAEEEIRVLKEAVAACRTELGQLREQAARPAKAERRRLPEERAAVTHKFQVAGHQGYLTVGLYEDGTPGEIFVKMAKEGSTVSGFVDAWATAVSMAIQAGYPLADIVTKFAHVRFEPAGFTGNGEIPMAKSIVDYVARWLGARFCDEQVRSGLGLQKVEGAGAGLRQALRIVAAATDTPQATVVQAPAQPVAMPAPAPRVGRGAMVSDTPSCPVCGGLTRRSGSCATCETCGSTTGCS